MHILGYRLPLPAYFAHTVRRFPLLKALLQIRAPCALGSRTCARVHITRMCPCNVHVCAPSLLQENLPVVGEARSGRLNQRPFSLSGCSTALSTVAALGTAIAVLRTAIAVLSTGINTASSFSTGINAALCLSFGTGLVLVVLDVKNHHHKYSIIQHKYSVMHII